MAVRLMAEGVHVLQRPRFFARTEETGCKNLGFNVFLQKN